MAVTNPGYIMYKTAASPAYLVKKQKIYESPDYQQPAYYSHLSRYKDLRTIKNKDDNRLIHETMFKYKIVESDGDIIYTITDKTKNRLDVIASMYYRNPQYWWIIAIANDIIDPLTELKIGTTIRIPPLLSIYETGSIFS